MKTFIFCILTALLTGNSAFAADRYSMSEKDGVTIRLDKQTGAMSYCRPVNGGMTCSMAADERQAWSAEMEAMANRIDLLASRIAALEAASEGKAVPESQTTPPEARKGGESTQSEEDKKFDSAMDRAETFMRRMVGVFKELRREMSTSQ